MRRSFLSLLVGSALLAGIPAQAFWQSRDSNYNVTINTVGYVGPGDIVSGASQWVGLKAYTTAYAAANSKMISLEPANSAVTCDINSATAGGPGLTVATCNGSTQGGITPVAFLGTDATANCTLSGNAAACSGAVGTIHVNDIVTGTGIANPCLVTATNGTTSATIGSPYLANSCGSLGSSTALTFAVPGYLPKFYDMSGNSRDCSVSNTTIATGTVATGTGTSLVIGGTVTGTFAVGQFLSGTGVPFGTIITASGGGGAGVYTTNFPTTIFGTTATAYQGPAQYLPDSGNGASGIYLYPGPSNVSTATNSAAVALYSCTLSGALNQPYTVNGVYNRLSDFGSNDVIYWDGTGGAVVGGAGSNQEQQYAGGSTQTASATDAAFHSVSTLFASSGAGIIVDGTFTGNTGAGANSWQTGTQIGRASFRYVGSFKGLGIWPLAFTATQYGNMAALQSGW